MMRHFADVFIKASYSNLGVNEKDRVGPVEPDWSGTSGGLAGSRPNPLLFFVGTVTARSLENLLIALNQADVSTGCVTVSTYATLCWLATRAKR